MDDTPSDHLVRRLLGGPQPLWLMVFKAAVFGSVATMLILYLLLRFVT